MTSYIRNIPIRMQYYSNATIQTIANRYFTMLTEYAAVEIGEAWVAYQSGNIKRVEYMQIQQAASAIKLNLLMWASDTFWTDMDAAGASAETVMAHAREIYAATNSSNWPDNYTCGSDMTVSDAIAYLAAGRTDQASVRTIAIELVARALDIALGDDYDANYNELYDWIEDGSFSGSETIASLAAEWRRIETQARSAR